MDSGLLGLDPGPVNHATTVFSCPTNGAGTATWADHACSVDARMWHRRADSGDQSGTLMADGRSSNARTIHCGGANSILRGASNGSIRYGTTDSARCGTIYSGLWCDADGILVDTDGIPLNV